MSIYCLQQKDRNGRLADESYVLGVGSVADLLEPSR